VQFEDLFRGSSAVDVAEECGDFVVCKGNGTPAYQLAVVVDDAAMRVTEVVRGDDLISSTPRQLLIYRALGWTPPRFAHVPLVVGADGLRLAKRHGDTRIETFRRQKVAPERLVGMLAAWSGLGRASGECMPRDLVTQFDWARIPADAVTWRGAIS
jgi:glutamyl-tRNA synthetase